MRIGPDGEPDGVTGDLAALLEREFDEDPALWVARSLEPKLADLARDEYLSLQVERGRIFGQQ